jgi:flagellar protein FliO/FliZ
MSLRVWVGTVLCLPLLAIADAPPGAAAAKAAPAAVVTTSPLNLILGLLFLVALVLLAAWLVRRMGGVQWPGARALKVVASLPVGARERVVLIEIAGEQMLLGVAPGSVNLLHRFEQPVITAASGGDDFASRIRQVLQQGLNR